MNTKQDVRKYDTFKFIVAIILAVIALLLWLRGSKRQGPVVNVTPVPTTSLTVSAPSVKLPAFPTANFKWRFDEAKKVLMTPDGVPVYKLDVEGKRWVPLIPDDLKASLP
ncbi:MAG: hypothetical protein GXO55_11360, partial [Chloroflexi bacterium]|nr:hypothetical protein [Chloroflexota bacterium]